ncbi:MAG: hypothetical protein JXA71_04785 [Chitinispirillaceae bacterium]|nr:hypothetical protein [Chitinispirillaceae bacterium]
MKNLWKDLTLVGAGVTGGVAVALMVKAAQQRNHPGRYENLGKSVDEKIRESKDALEKATAHVYGVFEQIRNLKV